VHVDVIWYVHIQCCAIYGCVTGVEDPRLTAEEMDIQRQENIAYEYLCHLEEAKVYVKFNGWQSPHLQVSSSLAISSRSQLVPMSMAFVRV